MNSINPATILVGVAVVAVAGLTIHYFTASPGVPIPGPPANAPSRDTPAATPNVTGVHGPFRGVTGLDV